jgi:hypothetical protein
MDMVLSPDCRDGNHTKCPGRAWNLILDDEVDCDCGCHDEED